MDESTRHNIGEMHLLDKKCRVVGGLTRQKVFDPKQKVSSKIRYRYIVTNNT